MTVATNPSLFARTVTRREVLVTSGAAAAVFALVGCGGATTPSAPGGAAPATGTFIGSVAMPDGALIAVHVGPAGDARGLLYGPRPVRPDGTVGPPAELTSEWFDGVVLTGDQLTGSSAGGYRLTATLAASGVKGNVTGPDGKPQEFQAGPATGTAGLYDLTFNTADQTLTGTSATGATVTSAKIVSAADPAAPVDVVLTITPVSGALAEFRVPFVPGNNENPPLGFIISPTGEIRGGPRKGRNTAGGSGSGFTCPIID